jgi:Flp pilus assembly protein protease CpaA
MEFMAFYERLQSELLLHGAQYKLYIEAATVAVLFYVALTDFLTFKIRNELIVLLLILYALFAFVTRSRIEVLTDIALALVIFAVLLWFYSQGAVGGGDVKLVTVACVWVGTHCTLLFAALLLGLGILHLIAAKRGWVRTKATAGRPGIPYAPSVAGALIGTMVLGCL